MTHRHSSGGTVTIRTDALTAVWLAALIFLGAVTPAVGIGLRGESSFAVAGNDELQAAGNEATDILETEEAATLTNGSATLQKKWAQMLLLHLRRNATDDQYNESLTALNQSIALATGPSQVANKTAFTYDATAISALNLTADTQRNREIILATHLIASADNDTATAQVAYAKWALNRTEDNLSSGARQSASAHIRNAERALERGRTTLAESAGHDLQARKRAIEQFRVAWLQATLALERIDAETTPKVTIRTRRDRVRNGSQSLTGQIRGEVFDIRPRELPNATVSVDGTQVKTTPIRVRDRRTDVTFAVNVTLEKRITSVTVSVADNDSAGLGNGTVDAGGDDQSAEPTSGNGASGSDGENGSNRQSDTSDSAGNGRANEGATDQSGGEAGPPGKGGPGGGSGDAPGTTARVGSDTVLFDGDGVPDTYERRVLGTDPQDPDSDSSRTSAPVADNGVIDGLEDFDADGLTNYHEGVFGTDPFVPDTDGDSLPDRYEASYPQLNQTAADTDNDGVRDPAWDPDNDSLNISRERAAGTLPFVPDTDRDGIRDGRELRIGTNASRQDTDGDTLTDGEELRLGTDPLSADSDNDGTTDGNTTYATTATNESLNVSVTLRGPGTVAAGVSVENGSLPQFQRPAIRTAQVTQFVNLESERSFDSANVTFEYTEAQLGETNESDLVVFRYNQSANLFEPLNTTVDAANNTVTGQTDQFSRFVVFDVRNWATNYLANEPAENRDSDSGGLKPVDVVFIIDSSGSMRSNDPQEFRKQASKEFVGALVEGDRAGVVDFDFDGVVTQSLTTDFVAVNRSIKRLDASGGTDIGAGVAAANREFSAASNNSRAKVAILLTDGRGAGGRAQARQAAEQNITIYTIGFGGANGDKLRDIARITGGNYTFVDSASDLPEVFSRVAQDVGQGVDSDGDGLSNRLERRGVPTTEGLIQTDPFEADTDNDGLSDSAELGPPTDFTELSDSTERELLRTLLAAGYDPANATGKIWTAPSSDPTTNDTDGDGLTDATETRTRTTVARTISREDTVTVLESGTPSRSTLEDAYGTTQVSSDPWRYDTDSDGLSDGRERTLGTDPDRRDTDEDGIDDRTEVRTRNDPSLYDVRPPTIEVQYAFYRIPETSLDTTYEVNVIASDDAGVQRLALLKGGDVRTSKTFDPTDRDNETVIETLSFTDRAVETRDVDTSSVKSTFTSVIGAASDAASSAAGTVADTTLGTTVYVRATDANENSRRRVGVQRANFYGEVSGDLFTGDSIIDRQAAETFGTVSGVSASFGVLFRDISTFIDDPTAFVDGIGALLEVIGEEGLGIADRLIDTYVKQFQRKQAQNNPYGSLDNKEYPDLYDRFRRNWYEGYVGGFLLKFVISAGVGKAAKSTVKNVDRVNDIADRLRDTRALRALARVQDAKEAAKGRVVARVLLASDDAAEPVLSQADTAGQAFRVWRVQRRIDADVADLPDSQQARLGRTIARGGPETARAIRQLDQDALDDLTDIDVTPTTRARLAPKYASLGPDRRAQLTRTIEANPRAGPNAARLETEAVRDALDYYCGGVLPAVGVGGGVTTDTRFAVGSLQTQCTVQTGLDSPMWRVDSDVRNRLADRLPESQFGRLVDSGVDPDALRAVDNLDTVSVVRRTDTGVKVEGTKDGIDVKVSYPDDDRRFYTRNSDDSIDEIRDRQPQQIGSDPVEEDIVPELIEEREGWDVIYGKQKGGTEQGIDVIAKDPDGNYVVTEVKFTTKTEVVDRDRVSASSREGLSGSRVEQMEDDWIETSFTEDISKSDLDEPSEYSDLRRAILQTNDYRKEAFVVQDGTVGKTTDSDLNGIDMDRVTVVRTNGATEE